MRRATEDFSGIAFTLARAVAQHLVQPGPGLGPVTVGGSPRQADSLLGLEDLRLGKERVLMGALHV